MMKLIKEKTIEVLGFDDTRFLMAGIPLVSFFIPLLFFNATLADGIITYLPKWGVSFAYTVAYWFSARKVFIYFRMRFPGHEEIQKRLFITGLALILVYAIVNFLLDGLHDRYSARVHQPGVTEFNYTVASFTIMILCVSVYEGIYLYSRWKQSIIETEQLKREHIHSQLEGLKSQVNPHFLFNSLNTLIYIIPENTDRAIQFVQKLSKVYRYILEIRDKKLIPLEEELDFLHSYIFLLKERFGDNLEVNLSIPSDILVQQVVPLSLQILFENAIKHNIISDKHPLKIEVFFKDEKLVVQNNLQLKKQAMPSTKVGLQNIKNRYAFFTDEKVDINDDGPYFKVTLPLIKMPVRAVS